MSRHLARLLLCTVVSAPLMLAAALVLEWFRIELEPTVISIGLSSATMCADRVCKTVGFEGMQGAYPILAACAFWGSLALTLLVVVQCGVRLLTGSGSTILARLGYLIGSAVFLAAFGAAYLFAPELPRDLAQMMGVAVMHTFAAPVLLTGCMFGMLALHYATQDGSDDTAYKPIVLAKDGADRLPVTPLNVKPVGLGPNARMTAPTGRERIVTPGSFERIPGTSPGDDRTKSPSQPPLVARTTSPGTRARTASEQTQPGDHTEVDPTRTGSPRAKTSSEPPLTARTGTPRAKTATEQPVSARTASSSQPPVSRTASSSQPPLSRTPTSSQPALARTGSQPLVARAKSASQQPIDRTKSPSQAGATGSDPGIPVDLAARARTSSSGPIDLAARLSGAPIAVSIKPPLPEPVPVPPDQIPVAPESGLVIRKRTQSAGPLSPHQLPLGVAAPAVAANTAVPRTATAGTSSDAMPSIALRSLADDHSDFEVGSTPLPPVMPPVEDDDIGDIAMGFGPKTHVGSMSSRASTTSIEPAYAGPPALQGKLTYAVMTAELSSTGIKAYREDGSKKLVAWDAIIGIIARRLPNEPPYESSTFVDLVSTAGSTLRILPWTYVTGAPILGEGEERARAFVQLIAARCLEAKMDSWTKVFADGAGRAAQLPSSKTLAAHDARLA